MHGPQVLFLDEPSTGLDPQARLFVHDRVHELRARAASRSCSPPTTWTRRQKLSDRVGIVDHGKLLALDTPSALVAAAARRGHHRFTLDAAPTWTCWWGGSASCAVCRAVEDLSGEAAAATHLRVRLRRRGRCRAPAGARRGGRRRRRRLAESRSASRRLEDVFIELTGRGLR